ncbi:Rha family transcriptional regulator [Bacillus albus]|uniref:Rha family transcriptional regulator n=1 Tax=Bacillus albus TaxID=2026189 RepID=UPI001F5DDCC0|nr:Rha family transcriptional regulator [Bacillus albus]
MSKLTPVNEQPTLSSLEVATMVGKRHDNLMADIKTHIGYLSKDDALKSQVVEYFKQGTYLDKKNEETRSDTHAQKPIHRSKRATYDASGSSKIDKYIAKGLLLKRKW